MYDSEREREREKERERETEREIEREHTRATPELLPTPPQICKGCEAPFALCGSSRSPTKHPSQNKLLG